MAARILFALARAVLLALLAVGLVGLSYTLSRELKPIGIVRMDRHSTSTMTTVVPSRAPAKPDEAPARKPRTVATPPPVTPAAPTAVVAVQPASRLRYPLPGFEGALRDTFDERRGRRRHEALDIMAPRGTPVLAVDDGRVAKLMRSPMGGISIYHRDPSGTRVYFYAHLDRYAPDLKQDAAIREGDVIGYVGSTGNAPEEAPHLHFALFELGEDKRWWKGRAVNPYALLKPG